MNILTVSELRDLAKKKEISGYSKMKKDELIEALK
ncbi:MAG: Rho termination factor N-terminal domain-containing protein [Bacilli bacterium]|nr:Rho termination factor N-terminal domain-containing protein [Bacilli bacterium]